MFNFSLTLIDVFLAKIGVAMVQPEIDDNIDDLVESKIRTYGSMKNFLLNRLSHRESELIFATPENANFPNYGQL